MRILRRHVFIAIAALTGIAVPALTGIAGVAMAAGPADDEVSLSGQKWLSLLDDQQYEESWDRAGAQFRDSVMKDQWADSLRRSRRPLGMLVSRTASRVDYAKTLRGSQDGEYAIIHYTTALEHKTITERLTLVKEDGKWQVAAYAIH
jgi:hypothetical protein